MFGRATIRLGISPHSSYILLQYYTTQNMCEIFISRCQVTIATKHLHSLITYCVDFSTENLKTTQPTHKKAKQVVKVI